MEQANERCAVRNNRKTEPLATIGKRSVQLSPQYNNSLPLHEVMQKRMTESRLRKIQ